MKSIHVSSSQNILLFFFFFFSYLKGPQVRTEQTHPGHVTEETAADQALHKLLNFFAIFSPPTTFHYRGTAWYGLMGGKQQKPHKGAYQEMKRMQATSNL